MRSSMRGKKQTNKQKPKIVSRSRSTELGLSMKVESFAHFKISGHQCMRMIIF